MNQQKAKQIRREVKQHNPDLPWKVYGQHQRDYNFVLMECQRAVYQKVKKAYKEGTLND